MSAFKPLLAAPIEFDKVDYSNLWGSPKYDGIRTIVRDGVLLSRSLKPIPNAYVQRIFGNRPELEGYDGELIVGPPNATDVYRVTNSGVMSKEGEPDAAFYAFDHIADPNEEYHERYNRINPSHRGVVKVEQRPVASHDHLIDLESWFLGQGYEGMMLRAFRGDVSRYKFGRSTAKATTLLKLKRFTDSEAIVIGFEEEMRNDNEAVKNALGHTERSSHQDNLVGKGRLGALVCRTTEGIEFRIGTGFDAADRAAFWEEREALLGKMVKFKHFEIGQKEAPRFPVYLGWRDPIDAHA